jgi:uncharacterized protein (TIGR02996 family)
MSDEAAFLNAILAKPTDNAPRLVYADWLNERGDPLADAKAGYLRDTALLMTARARHAKRLWRRLHAAAASLPSDWLAVVSRVTIENCGNEFQLRCPKQWEELTATADLKVRACAECKQAVYYCATIHEARAHAGRGECVCVELGFPRTPGDLEGRRMLIGKITPRGPVR